MAILVLCTFGRLARPTQQPLGHGQVSPVEHLADQRNDTRRSAHPEPLDHTAGERDRPHLLRIKRPVARPVGIMYYVYQIDALRYGPAVPKQRGKAA
jgi:hypothetical protein